ncbi:hypothetical protein P691DRAFT_780692 [Macrolepiota fuliginosa MF-IS2]|uniref:Uncharacterized protein n=1 Tax=Macrolepiota fuliginosa MF-IS2 TaxID=1400762 RepID=A0A9P5WXX0_9AGAR|nr:hypothetical protein P691DRAFT_780692 [Macrolepiota fuliginosa MF-IS2]
MDVFKLTLDRSVCLMQTHRSPPRRIPLSSSSTPLSTPPISFATDLERMGPGVGVLFVPQGVPGQGRAEGYDHLRGIPSLNTTECIDESCPTTKFDFNALLKQSFNSHIPGSVLHPQAFRRNEVGGVLRLAGGGDILPMRIIGTSRSDYTTRTPTNDNPSQKKKPTSLQRRLARPTLVDAMNTGVGELFNWSASFVDAGPNCERSLDWPASQTMSVVDESVGAQISSVGVPCIGWSTSFVDAR